MTEKYKMNRDGIEEYEEYGIESPILKKNRKLTYGEVVDNLNAQTERIEKIKKHIVLEIKQREEDLRKSVKAGMPTGLMYSEIELLEKLLKIMDGDTNE